MKIARTVLGILLVVLNLAAMASAAPFVGFSQDTKSVTASGTFRTPSITVTGAAGVTYVNLTISIPEEVTINTALDPLHGNLICVKQGLGVSGVLFHSEWDPAARIINVSTPVNSGTSIELIQYIEFSTSGSISSCRMELGGSVTGGTGTALFGYLTISPPHAVSVSSCTATPSQLASAGATNCAVVAADSYGHGLTYAWSDGGAGGSFSPSAAIANPAYTAPTNETGSSRSITLRCTLTCQENSTVSAVASAVLILQSVPPNTIAVTSTPNANAHVTFSPTPDSASMASPMPAPVTLSYMPSARGVRITAAKQDSATNPMWFDHWTIDGVNQPQGQLVAALDMDSSNHAAVAVYAGLVGDLNADGYVNKSDAQVILRALMAGSSGNPLHDVDMSGTVDIRDAHWIVVHRN